MTSAPKLEHFGCIDQKERADLGDVNFGTDIEENKSPFRRVNTKLSKGLA